nr:hypothetical protein [uncultured Cupriavidus sp.]
MRLPHFTAGTETLLTKNSKVIVDLIDARELHHCHNIKRRENGRLLMLPVNTISSHA